MELEKAGTCYEPQLKRLALNVLRKRFTDGKIDEMLKPPSLTYDDVVSFLKEGGEEVSVLRTLFRGAQSEALLTEWLGNTDRDKGIAKKEATEELLKLIEARLGLELDPLAEVVRRRLTVVISDGAESEVFDKDNLLSARKHVGLQ